jgi:hypothetical protein
MTSTIPARSHGKKSGGSCLSRRSLIQGATNQAPWLSSQRAQEFWWIDENTQSDWRMIV